MVRIQSLQGGYRAELDQNYYTDPDTSLPSLFNGVPSIMSASLLISFILTLAGPARLRHNFTRFNMVNLSLTIGHVFPGSEASKRVLPPEYFTMVV